MAAHRIRSTTTNNNVSLPRCRSEGTLIDLSEGVSEATLNNVKGQNLQVLFRLDSIRLHQIKFYSNRTGEIVEFQQRRDRCKDTIETMERLYSSMEKLYMLHINQTEGP